MNDNKLTIPEIAARLREIAVEQGLHEIRDLADQLARRPQKTRAPAASVKMTNALGDKIRAYHTENLHLTQASLAYRFNVNSGRVSEALNGKWQDEQP